MRSNPRRWVSAIVLMAAMAALVGCGEKKPQPSERYLQEVQKLKEQQAKKKAFAIAVAQGKAQAPQPGAAAAPPQPSPVVDGACPTYDNVKIGTKILIGGAAAKRFNLPEGNYQLDGSCRPVRLDDPAVLNPFAQQAAAECTAPFYGFRPGDGLEVEEKDVPYFGLLPGLYGIMQFCKPLLVAEQPKHLTAELRKTVYKAYQEKRNKARLEMVQKAAKDGFAAQNAGLVIAARSEFCPAPLNAYRRGNLVRLDLTEEAKVLKVLGYWLLDTDCQPTWQGPGEVTEPAVILEQIEREKPFPYTFHIIGVLLLLGLGWNFNSRIKKATGKNAWAWYTRKKS
jgi:hypothetical protein